jgi:hypothetical protein
MKKIVFQIGGPFHPVEAQPSRKALTFHRSDLTSSSEMPKNTPFT